VVSEYEVLLKYSETTCPSATLSTTNYTLIGPRSNPGSRCDSSDGNS